jgi:hypothetical protein
MVPGVAFRRTGNVFRRFRRFGGSLLQRFRSIVPPLIVATIGALYEAASRRWSQNSYEDLDNLTFVVARQRARIRKEAMFEMFTLRNRISAHREKCPVCRDSALAS